MIDRWVLQAGRGLGWLSLGMPHRRAFDVLSAALALAVPVLVLTVDAQLALLAFLTIPFIALANAGRRRLVWCALALGACAASTVIASVPPATTAVRMPLVVIDVVVVLALAQAFQREAREAELRRELTAEAHHRIKNSLQGVADLLYLAREEGDEGLDRAADRIRSIAAVHELLGRHGGESVAVDELLRRVAAGLDGGIEVRAAPLALPLERAQRVGIVANELLTNAARHGRAPITLTLDGGDAISLTVEDAGRTARSATAGTGLTLVRHVVEYGLDGTLEVQNGEAGTRARVAFPRRTPCAS
jgi:two-component sensor histidine kinase